jgi:hypothetical protein
VAFVYFTCAVNSISINSGNIWLHWGEEAMTPHSFTLCSLHGCLILTPPPTPPIQDYNLINRGSEFESLEHWGFCLETLILILAFFPMPRNLTFHWEFVILKKKKKSQQQQQDAFPSSCSCVLWWKEPKKYPRICILPFGASAGGGGALCGFIPEALQGRESYSCTTTV